MDTDENFQREQRIEELISLALEEDLNGAGDVTANALIGENVQASIEIRARSKGVISGIEVASKTFAKVDSNIKVKWNLEDGQSCETGSVVGTLIGPLRSILTAERTALNFLQHLSGVASLTRKFVDELERIGSTTRIRDTRKTIPGYRLLEKNAVVHGGGLNHRMGLYDAFLVKDNHLEGASLEEVVEKCRSFDSQIPLEVEVDNLEQLKVVAAQSPDLIMLDNFTVEDVKKAVDFNLGVPLEVSGGVTFETVGEYGSTNVKYLAVGALTHSAPALDIGFDLL